MFEFYTEEMVVDPFGDLKFDATDWHINPNNDGDFPMYVKVDGAVFARRVRGNTHGMYNGPGKVVLEIHTER